MLKSFFINESGFVAPWTGLSWSWVAGIIVGAFSLLKPVITVYAQDDNCITEQCYWLGTITCCCDDGWDPVITCEYFAECECT